MATDNNGFEVVDAPALDPNGFEVVTAPAAPAPEQFSAGRQAFGRFVQGAAGVAAGLPEAIAITADRIGQAFPSIDEGKSLEELDTYKLAKGIRETAARLAPVDPNRPKSFWVDTVPGGAGSMAGFLAGGAAGRVAKVPALAATAVMGAATGGADAYDAAKQSGGTDEQAWTSFLVNAGAGTSEALPIARWLGGLDRATGGIVRRAVKEGSEEAVQEIFQQAVNNVDARAISGFDPDRPWLQGTGEGGAAGLTLGAVASLLFPGRQRGQREQAPPAPAVDANGFEIVPPQPIGEDINARLQQADPNLNVTIPVTAQAQPGVPDAAPAVAQPPQAEARTQDQTIADIIALAETLKKNQISPQATAAPESTATAGGTPTGQPTAESAAATQAVGDILPEPMTAERAFALAKESADSAKVEGGYDLEKLAAITPETPERPRLQLGPEPDALYAKYLETWAEKYNAKRSAQQVVAQTDSKNIQRQDDSDIAKGNPTTSQVAQTTQAGTASLGETGGGSERIDDRIRGDSVSGGQQVSPGAGADLQASQSITLEEITATPDAELNARFKPGTIQRVGVESGAKMSEADVPALEKLRDDSNKKAVAALKAKDNEGFMAHQNRGLWASGAIEGARKKGPNYEAVTAQSETPEKVRAGRDWNNYAEDLRSDLDSFSPARDTGRTDYDLMDVADRFVEFAKADTTGTPIEKLVSSFAKTDDATKSQIKKLREAVRSVEAAQQPPASAQPTPQPTPEKVRVGKSPQPHTVIDRPAPTPVEAANKEQPVRVRNDKTGEESTVLESDVKAIISRKPSKETNQRTDEAEKRLGGLKVKVKPNKEAGFTNILQIIADLTLAGARMFANGARHVANWTRAMTKKFGNDFKPWLQQVWENIKSLASGKIEPGQYSKSKLFRTVATMIRGHAVGQQFDDIANRNRSLQKFMEENLRELVHNAKVRLKEEFPLAADFETATKRLEAYWLGQAPLSSVGGPAVQLAAERFRQELDSLAVAAVNNGLVPGDPADPNSQSATWMNNTGEWLKRTFLAFDPTADWNYDQLNKRRKAGDAEITRIWNAAEAYLRRQNPKATDSEIEAMMRHLIDRREAADALTGSQGGQSGFKTDIGSLLRRKDIPPELLEWMGQIRDPFVRASQSSKWISQFIARNLMQREMAQMGLAQGWFSEKQDARNHVELFPNKLDLKAVIDPVTGKPVKTASGNVEAEVTTKVDRRHEPLHGLYTSPEMQAALAEFDNQFNTQIAATHLPGMLGKAYLDAVGWWKLGKVALNPYSYAVNSFGAVVLRLAAGAANPISLARAARVVASRHMTIDASSSAKAQKARADFLLATKAGVTGKGILTSEQEASFNQVSEPEAFKRFGQALTQWAKGEGGTGAKTRMARAVKDILRLPGDIGIRFVDDIARTQAFLHEFDLSKQVAAHSGWTEQQHMEWAAERASNIYQTYEKLPKIVRDSSNVGISAPFISFKLEMLRNLFNIAKYGGEGLRSSDPALRRDGAFKLLGMVGTVLVPMAIATMSRLNNMGDDDEENKKKVQAMQRWFVPPWDRGEELAIKSWENNKVSYVPMGYIFPTYEAVRLPNEIAKAATGGSSERDFDKIIEGLWQDYMGGGLATTLGETAFNQRMSGGKISYQEGASNLGERLDYLWRNAQPGVTKMASDLTKAATGETGHGGTTYSAGDVANKTLGLRVRTVDLNKAVPYTMREFSARWRDASTSASVVKNKTNNEDKIAAAERYKAEKHAELKRSYKDFKRDAKLLGIPTSVILQAEKDAALPVDLRE